MSVFKKCPFCGGDADFLSVWSKPGEEGHGDKWRMRCTGNCGVCGPVKTGKNAAAMAWNMRFISGAEADRRVRIAALEAENESLRTALEKARAYIPSDTVECRGDKCRELWCVSCFGDETAEREIERAKFLAEEIRAALEASR